MFYFLLLCVSVSPAWKRNTNNRNGDVLRSPWHLLERTRDTFHMTFPGGYSTHALTQAYEYVLVSNIYWLWYVTFSFHFVSFHFISILFGPSTMKWEIKQKTSAPHPCEHETLLKVHEKRNTLKWKYLWKARETRTQDEHRRETKRVFSVRFSSCSVGVMQYVRSVQNVLYWYRKTEFTVYMYVNARTHPHTIACNTIM